MYGGGQDYDYSGGNLKYGTGKYTQRGNDGYQGGVNLSKNGRSMQDSVYREDRNNVDRARGRARSFDRMDEIEDMEMGRRGSGGPREGMRDRMMRGRGRDGGFYEDSGFEGRGGIRDRMGGSGLLRDHQGIDGRHRERTYGYDDGFGTPPKVMGGSSNSRGGGYRSSQFEADISNERRRFEDYGFRIDDYLDERDGVIDYDSRGGARRRRSGGSTNFDRIMGRGRDGRGDYHDDHHYDDYNAGSRGMGGRFGGQHGFQDDYRGGDDYGSRGDGRLLRDMRRP